MKKLINLFFDRIERVLWFRYLIWLFKEYGNTGYTFRYGEKGENHILHDILSDNDIGWFRKHRNDYLEYPFKKATGTENSTHVTDDKS